MRSLPCQTSVRNFFVVADEPIIVGAVQSLDGFRPGALISDRFTILKEIGKGGMGVVFLAHDTRLDKDVALKFLSSELRLDETAKATMKRETLKSLELTHPNIVRIHDFHDPDDAPPFIAMEYVKGLTVKMLMKQQANRLLPWDWTAKIAAPLCSALIHAHALGIIHRDLKPANVLIDYDGQVKLSDFGVAAQIRPTAPDLEEIPTGSGTLTFMSPEQMWGNQAVVQDDVYSLGATLYAMLTGRPPFFSGNIEFQVWHKPVPAIPIRLQELKVENEIPNRVVVTIMQCLEKEAEERPRSIGEVCRMLDLDANPNHHRLPLSKSSNS